MTKEWGALLQEIRPAFNRAFARGEMPENVLASMWDVGEILRGRHLDRPHSAGWALQEVSAGLVKRAFIFRSAKVREIWVTREELLKECHGLRSVSNVVEMLPYLDPPQRAHYRLTEADLGSLRKSMVVESAMAFKQRLSRFKKEHPVDKLGAGLDRNQRLSEVVEFATMLEEAEDALQKVMDSTGDLLDDTATSDVAVMLKVAAGAISPPSSRLAHPQESTLLQIVTALTESGALRSEVRRKRLWRLYPRERLMELGEMVLALSSEKGREEFHSRRRLAEAIVRGTADAGR